MMRRLTCILSVMLCLGPVGVRAQYSVNVDYKTVAAMTAAYAAGEVSEVYYHEQLKDIFKEYAASEAGAAAIFASKFLDRKALTDISTWTSPTENLYYRRIYNMVSAKIMPKIWTVGGLMLEHPQDALTWGTYLVGVCDETKNLCMQFESVVTNSRLNFSSISFLKVSDEAAAAVDVATAGGRDWKQSLKDLAARGRNSITKENLKSDINTLKDKAGAMVAAGASNLSEALLQKSSFNSLFQGDISSAVTIVDNYSALLGSLEDDAGATILEMAGGRDAVASLFDVDDYNMTSWVSDYLLESKGTYYTQHWTIEKVDEGSEVICDYTPDQSKDNIINGSEWTRFGTSDPDFYPSGDQYDRIYDNSKRYTGVDVDYLLDQSGKNGNRYRLSTTLYGYRITTNGDLTEKSYAYGIKITHTWNRTETVYDDVFDSFRMDEHWFQQHMDQKLSDLQEDNPDSKFVIRKGERNYYQTTDEKKMQGCEAVAITVTCTDGTTLADGVNDYKCYTCESEVNAHTRLCVMYTSKDEEAGDILAELSEKISVLEDRKNEIESREISITASILVLKLKKLFASGEKAEQLQAEIDGLYDEYDVLDEELDGIKAELDQLNSVYEEVAADEAEDDEFYRMPAIMADLKTAFDLEWQDAGHWEGNWFIRTAKVPDMNGTVTFKAYVSLARRAQYLLGIKIHRAIVRTTWELRADWVESTVADILIFDSSMTDAQKAQRVNERMSEIASMYPDCKVTAEYSKSDPPEEDATDDTFHLLWSSDRLRVAREVDARLTQIYADLVSLEKMMSYGRSAGDLLRMCSRHLDMDLGRRRTVIEECRENWKSNADLRNR